MGNSSWSDSRFSRRRVVLTSALTTGISTPVSQYTTVILRRSGRRSWANAWYTSFSTAEESLPPLNPTNHGSRVVVNSSRMSATVARLTPSVYGGALNSLSDLPAFVSCNKVELLIGQLEMTRAQFR